MTSTSFLLCRNFVNVFLHILCIFIHFLCTCTPHVIIKNNFSYNINHQLISLGFFWFCLKTMKLCFLNYSDIYLFILVNCINLKMFWDYLTVFYRPLIIICRHSIYFHSFYTLLICEIFHSNLYYHYDIWYSEFKHLLLII